jgi:Xaa-Pro aminopeptidase
MGKKTLFRNGLLAKLRRRVRSAGLGAFLVTGKEDICYLAGYYSEGAKLLVAGEDAPVYFIDRMNEELCRDRLKGLKLADIVAGSVNEKIKEHIKAKKLKKIGINEKLIQAFEYKSVLSGKGLRFRHVPGLLEDMREVKEQQEITLLRKAARQTVKIWKEIKKNLEPGMSEKEIADMIDVLVRALGYENSFPTIVAAGKNTAYPHAVPGSKRFKDKEHLLVDFGVRLEGYCSDLTRTYSKGRINRKIADFRDLVRSAHDQAIKMIKPGAVIGSVAEMVDIYFNNNSAGDYVLHGLGHGVGLNIHEKPLFRKGNRTRFKKGMVVTVEPGLYLPGIGGVREEDMVLVTANGCEVLTR